MAQKKSGAGKKVSADPLSPESRCRRFVEGLRRDYFFYSHGPDGVFTYLSPSITSVLGYSQAEFLSNFHKYLTPNPKNKLVDKYTAGSLKGRRQPPYEVEAYHKDGSVRTLEVLEIPVRAGGRVVAVDGIAKDITEQKLARELLERHGREAEEQARLILQSSGEGVVGVDQDGRVTFANRAALRLLGWTARELVGRPLHETIHYKKADGSPYPVSQCPMNAALAGGREHRNEAELLFRKDGTSFPAAYSSRPMKKDGRPAGAVVTFSDISGRKSLERMKDFLMHAIVHDLNTPLSVIMAGAELAAECPGRLPNCGNRDSLAMVFEMANEMKRMLSDILDVNRMEEGRMRLDIRPARPGDLVKAAVKGMTPLAKINQRRLEVREDGPLPEVAADRGAVRRVLENLISNAMRYTPAGTAITVSAAKAADGVVFSVTDEGLGIKPAHLDRVFEKYFQSDGPQLASRQGKGLGLTFCRMAVDSHGGKIWAENLPVAGCRFSFLIPLAPGTGAAKG